MRLLVRIITSRFCCNMLEQDQPVVSADANKSLTFQQVAISYDVC